MSSKPFYDRLSDYYVAVASALRGEAAAASVFPNAGDIGSSRERIYAEFLRQHIPSRCNVLFGGFLFGQAGKESDQLDIIVTNEASLRFDFLNSDGSGKAFACIDGCIAVVSSKSQLTTATLHEALDNLSSLPEKLPLGNRGLPFLKYPDYDDWPVKIIFARDGVSAETAMEAIEDYYDRHPEVPRNRRPDVIHVAGKYYIQALNQEHLESLKATESEKKIGYVFHAGPGADGLALHIVTQYIQLVGVHMAFILTSYTSMLGHLPEPKR
jgi:hypothetical protein